MTAVKGFYAEQNLACTHNGTGWSRGDDPFLPQILGSALTANNKYLIVATAMIASDDSNKESSWRISTADDATIATKSQGQTEPVSTTTTNRGLVQKFVHSFETDGTPADVNMEMENTTDSADNVFVDQSSLKLIDLTDLGTPNYFETIHGVTGTAYGHLGDDVTGENSDDIIDATAHPFSNGDSVQFVALTGGSSLATFTVYWVINVTADTFQIAATSGGAALDFGSDITATSTLAEATVMWTIPGSDLGTDEWLILGYQRSDMGGTTMRHRVEVLTALDASTSSVVFRDHNESEDSSERRLHGFELRHKASSGTPDVQVIGWMSASNAGVQDGGGYGIAIKKSAFESIVFAYTAATITVNSTEKTVQNIDAHSQPTTADTMIFGSFNMADMTNSGLDQIHVEDDGTPIRTGDQPMQNQAKYDALSQAHYGVAHETNIPSSDTSDYDLQATTGSATDDTAEHRWLIIWSMELAAAAADVYPPFPRRQNRRVRM